MPFEALSAKARLIVPVGRDRQQVAVADAVRRGSLRGSSSGSRAAKPEARYGSASKSGNAPFSARERHAGAVGGVAHRPRELAPPCARASARVVAQAEHDQRVAEAGEAEADPPLVRRLALPAPAAARR